MSKVTHTPGPWVVNGGTIEAPNALSDKCKEPRIIGEVLLGLDRSGFRVGSKAEQAANARLIAAAPRLLATLERLEKEVSDTVGPGFVDCGDDPLLIAVFEARVAIEAAKGGAA